MLTRSALGPCYDEGMPASEPILRHAARVLVVDSLGRVLLQQYKVPGGADVFWATPGGGLDPGETHEAAARRVLTDGPPGEPVDVGV